MAIAGLDDILRRILGLQKPPPDNAGVFEDDDDPSIAEGDRAPVTREEMQQQQLQGGHQYPLYYPGQDKRFVGPMIIPNNREEDDAEVDKRTPLRRGNAKYGSGIDI